MLNGQDLKRLREDRGLRASFVAERSGYSPQHLSKIERKTDGLRLEEFVRITAAMGYKPGDLLEHSGAAAVVRPDLAPLILWLAALPTTVVTHMRAVAEMLGVHMEEREVQLHEVAQVVAQHQPQFELARTVRHSDSIMIGHHDSGDSRFYRPHRPGAQQHGQDRSSDRSAS